MDKIIEERIKKIFKNIAQKEVSHIIISNWVEPFVDSNFFYLTGVISGTFEGSFAIASRDGRLMVITSDLEAETARGAGLEVLIPERKPTGLKDGLTGALKGHKAIGLNFAGIVNTSKLRLEKLMPKSKFIDVGMALENARMIKDDAETSMLRRSAEIATAAFAKIKAAVKEGVKETTLAAAVNYELMSLGATGPSFDTICATGKNGAEPHHLPDETITKRGDIIVCDYGARYRRYCSDTTRTFIVGKPGEKARKMYETVLAAQKAALDTIKPGAEGRRAHEAALRVIDAAGFKGRFTHGIGHSLGLDVHDSSLISPFGDTKLEEGMVLTVEPGIYIPGFGGVRIEDDILVTKDGYELLTTAPKSLEDAVVD